MEPRQEKPNPWLIEGELDGSANPWLLDDSVDVETPEVPETDLGGDGSMAGPLGPVVAALRGLGNTAMGRAWKTTRASGRVQDTVANDVVGLATSEPLKAGDRPEPGGVHPIHPALQESKAYWEQIPLEGEELTLWEDQRRKDAVATYTNLVAELHELNSLPMGDATKRFVEGEFSALADNPAQIAGELGFGALLSSIPSLVGGIGGALIGGAMGPGGAKIGSAFGSFTGSYHTEYKASMLDAIDFVAKEMFGEHPDGKSYLADSDFMLDWMTGQLDDQTEFTEAVFDFANAKALTTATFDAASAAMLSKSAAASMAKQGTALRHMRRLAIDVGRDSFLEGAGELAGQAASRGIDNVEWYDGVVETVASIPLESVFNVGGINAAMAAHGAEFLDMDWQGRSTAAAEGDPLPTVRGSESAINRFAMKRAANKMTTEALTLKHAEYAASGISPDDPTFQILDDALASRYEKQNKKDERRKKWRGTQNRVYNTLLQSRLRSVIEDLDADTPSIWIREELLTDKYLDRIEKGNPGKKIVFNVLAPDGMLKHSIVGVDAAREVKNGTTLEFVLEEADLIDPETVDRTHAEPDPTPDPVDAAVAEGTGEDVAPPEPEAAPVFGTADLGEDILTKVERFKSSASHADASSTPQAKGAATRAARALLNAIYDANATDSRVTVSSVAALRDELGLGHSQVGRLLAQEAPVRGERWRAAADKLDSGQEGSQEDGEVRGRVATSTATLPDGTVVVSSSTQSGGRRVEYADALAALTEYKKRLGMPDLGLYAVRNLDDLAKVDPVSYGQMVQYLGGGDPAVARAQAGAGRDAFVMLQKGRGYIFTDNISDSDHLAQILGHESTHLGLRALDPEMGPVFAAIYEVIPEVDGVETREEIEALYEEQLSRMRADPKLSAEAAIEALSLKRKALVAEEWLAKFSEGVTMAELSKKTMSERVATVKRAVQRGLKQGGRILGSTNEFAEDDALQLIREARKALQGRGARALLYTRLGVDAAAQSNAPAFQAPSVVMDEDERQDEAHTRFALARTDDDASPTLYRMPISEALPNKGRVLNIGQLQSEYGLDRDKATALYNEQRARREEYEASVRRALAEGKISFSEVVENMSRAQRDRHNSVASGILYELRGTQPLFQQGEYYHVTIRQKQVVDEGLKTAREVMAQNPALTQGLGGTPDFVSVTYKREHAEGVVEGFVNMRNVLRGDLTYAELERRAKAGDGGSKPFFEDWQRSYRSTGPRWLNDIALNDFKEGRLSGYERDLAAFNLYRRWSMSRDLAGGPQDPLFVPTILTNPNTTAGNTFAGLKNADVALLTLRPRLGATAAQVVAQEHEMRTRSGGAWDIEKVEDENLNVVETFEVDRPKYSYSMSFESRFGVRKLPIGDDGRVIGPATGADYKNWSPSDDYGGYAPRIELAGMPVSKAVPFIEEHYGGHSWQQEIDPNVRFSLNPSATPAGNMISMVPEEDKQKLADFLNTAEGKTLLADPEWVSRTVAAINQMRRAFPPRYFQDYTWEFADFDLPQMVVPNAMFMDNIVGLDDDALLAQHERASQRLWNLRTLEANKDDHPALTDVRMVTQWLDEVTGHDAATDLLAYVVAATSEPGTMMPRADDFREVAHLVKDGQLKEALKVWSSQEGGEALREMTLAESLTMNEGGTIVTAKLSEDRVLNSMGLKGIRDTVFADVGGQYRPATQQDVKAGVPLYVSSNAVRTGDGMRLFMSPFADLSARRAFAKAAKLKSGEKFAANPLAALGDLHGETVGAATPEGMPFFLEQSVERGLTGRWAVAEGEGSWGRTEPKITHVLDKIFGTDDGKLAGYSLAVEARLWRAWNPSSKNLRTRALNMTAMESNATLIGDLRGNFNMGMEWANTFDLDAGIRAAGGRVIGKILGSGRARPAPAVGVEIVLPSGDVATETYVKLWQDIESSSAESGSVYRVVTPDTPSGHVTPAVMVRFPGPVGDAVAEGLLARTESMLADAAMQQMSEVLVTTIPDSADMGRHAGLMMVPLGAPDPGVVLGFYSSIIDQPEFAGVEVSILGVEGTTTVRGGYERVREAFSGGSVGGPNPAGSSRWEASGREGAEAWVEGDGLPPATPRSGAAPDTKELGADDYEALFSSTKSEEFRAWFETSEVRRDGQPVITHAVPVSRGGGPVLGMARALGFPVYAEALTDQLATEGKPAYLRLESPLDLTEANPVDSWQSSAFVTALGEVGWTFNEDVAYTSALAEGGAYEFDGKRHLPLWSVVKAMVPAESNSEVAQVLASNAPTASKNAAFQEMRMKALADAAVMAEHDGFVFNVDSNYNNTSWNEAGRVYVALTPDAVWQSAESVRPLFASAVGTGVAAQAAAVEQAQTGQTILRAPNGEWSNLQRSHWLMVRTPAFKSLFGDWEADESLRRSLDANREPKLRYASGVNVSNSRTPIMHRVGVALHDDPAKAAHYASTSSVAPVFAPTRKPYQPPTLFVRSIMDGAETALSEDMLTKWFEKNPYEFGLVVEGVMSADLSERMRNGRGGTEELDQYLRDANRTSDHWSYVYGKLLEGEIPMIGPDGNDSDLLVRYFGNATPGGIASDWKSFASDTEQEEIATDYRDTLIAEGYDSIKVANGVIALDRSSVVSAMTAESLVIGMPEDIRFSLNEAMGDAHGRVFMSNLNDLKSMAPEAAAHIESEISAVVLPLDKEGNRVAGHWEYGYGNESHLSDFVASLVRTPSFKSWFGDWENAKVGDPMFYGRVHEDTGEPKMFFHGTPRPDHTMFRVEAGNVEAAWGRGIYLSTDKYDAAEYARENNDNRVKAHSLIDRVSGTEWEGYTLEMLFEEMTVEQIEAIYVQAGVGASLQVISARDYDRMALKTEGHQDDIITAWANTVVYGDPEGDVGKGKTRAFFVRYTDPLVLNHRKVADLDDIEVWVNEIIDEIHDNPDMYGDVDPDEVAAKWQEMKEDAADRRPGPRGPYERQEGLTFAEVAYELSEITAYATDYNSPDGASTKGQLYSEAARRVGYDAILMEDVKNFFGRQYHAEDGANHAIVFHPQDTKLTGNAGSWGTTALEGIHPDDFRFSKRGSKGRNGAARRGKMSRGGLFRGGGKSPESMFSIVDALQKAFHVTIIRDKANAGANKARADRRGGAIVTRRFDAFPEIAREIGRVMFSRVFAKDIAAMEAADAKAVIDEIRAMATLADSATSKAKQYNGAGEFFKLWFADEKAAKKAAPKYFALVESAMERDGYRSDAYMVRELVDQWDTRDLMSVFEAGLFQHGDAPIFRNRQSFKQWLTGAGEWLVSKWFDHGYVIMRMMHEVMYYRHIAEGKSPDEFFNSIDRWSVDDNAYKLWRLGAGHVGKTRHMMKHGVRTLEGTNPLTGEVGQSVSLEAALAPVVTRIRDFERYATARRLKEITQQMARGERPADYNMPDGWDEDVADAVLGEFAKDKKIAVFEKAFDDLQEFNQAMLALAKHEGFIGEKDFDNIVEMNQNYIPWQRVDPNLQRIDVAKKGRGTSAEKQRFAGGTIKSIKHGSEMPIEKPIENLLANTFAMVKAIEKNRVMQAIWRMIPQTIVMDGKSYVDPAFAWEAVSDDLKSIANDSIDAESDPDYMGRLSFLREHGFLRELKQDAHAISENQAIQQWLRVVPPPTALAKKKESAAKILKQLGQDPAVDKRALAKLMQNAGDFESVLITMSVPVFMEGEEEQVMPVRVGGDLHYIAMPTVLFESIERRSPWDAITFVKTLASFASLLRKGATAWNPAFFVPNFVRDVVTRGFQSRLDMRLGPMDPFKVVSDPVLITSQLIAESIMGKGINMHADDRLMGLHQEFMLSGAYGATLTSFDRNFLRDEGGEMAWAGLKAMHKGVSMNPLGLIRFMGHTQSSILNLSSSGIAGGAIEYARGTARLARNTVLGPIEKFNNSVEEVNRLAEWKAVYRQEYDQIKATSPELNEAQVRREAVQRAGLAARDVTLDFSRAGQYGRTLNMIVPFANATLQGTSRVAESMASNPARVLLWGTTLVAGSLALQKLIGDNPWYDEEPEYLRHMYWLIPNIDGPVDKNGWPMTFVRVPKPHLWGMTSASLAETYIRWLKTDKPEVWDEYMRSVGQTLPINLHALVDNESENYLIRLYETFDSLIGVQALVPIVESTTNLDFFRNRPIEPYYMQNSLVSSQRYDATDHPSAIYLSRALENSGVNLSAKQIEHLIYGYTAGLGGIALSVFDEPARKLANEDFNMGIGEKPKQGGHEAWGMNVFHRLYEELESDDIGHNVVTAFPRAVVKSFIVNQPGYSAMSVRRFFNMADAMKKKSLSMSSRMEKETVESALDYFERHKGDILLGSSAAKDLTDMGKYGTVIRGIYEMDGDPVEKRKLLDTMYELLVWNANIYNRVYSEVLGVDPGNDLFVPFEASPEDQDEWISPIRDHSKDAAPDLNEANRRVQSLINSAGGSEAANPWLQFRQQQ